MAKVFVTQYTKRINFTEAANYGEVVFLTDQEFRPMPHPNGVNKEVVDEIKRNMSLYVPGVDFIMTTGSALPNVVVGMILGRMPGATHKFLKWSNRMEGYEMFELTLNDLINI